MSDRDDEDETKDANSDRRAPQLGLPIDAPKSDEAPKLREPRLTRAPSFSAPANDRPAGSGDRSRLSAPPRADGNLFDRQPPPFRRPSAAPPPLPRAASGGASSNKSAMPGETDGPSRPRLAEGPKTPHKGADASTPDPEIGKLESGKPKSEAPAEKRPPDAQKAPAAQSAPPTAAPASDMPRERPEPRATADFQDLPEPPRPRFRDDNTATTAETRSADTGKPVNSVPTGTVSASRDPGRQKPAQARPAPESTRREASREPTPLRPRRVDAGSVEGNKTSKAKPVLVTKNEGLVVHSLGKQFKKRPVLRDVSLRVQRGEAVGLLGPNGAGKTTCFYIVTGLISADYGQIVLDGVDITELPMYRRSRLGIGYLPQESSIFRGLTVEQNIMAVLELIEKNRERREITLENLLAEFSISHLRRTPAIALSGGERRRLEIARALASQPNFVLLDEPLAGIDPIAVRDIRELVSHLKDRGIGVLITDHNVRETLDIVDRAYILHDGNVLMEGTPDEIVANQEVRRVYLGDRFSL